MSKIRSLFYKNNNSNKNKKKTTKIILNKPEDLLRISKEDFDKINISNLCGDYYEQIYKEALEIEKKNAKLKNNKKSKEKNNDIKNSKSKILNNKKNQTNNLKSILRKNQRERMLNKKPSKSRSKSKEKNIIIKNHNYKILANQFNVNIINNVKDKKHLLSPEIPSSKINNFEFEKIKDNNINKNNKNQFNLNLFQNKKIEVNLLPAFDKIKKNNQKNNIISKKGENTNNNNKIKINYTKYKSDEIKINKKNNNNNHYKINKMVFYVRYDSNYGDNIGILGSIDQLGNWSQDKILYLKWNNGNIWKGEIDLDNSNISRFEFKFINRYDGIIYWEKGFNNIIDLNALEEEVRCQKKGRFNKFEYSYDINNSEITLTCKIKEWE